MTIELVVAVLTWLFAVVAAFWYVGAVAGILVIVLGACAFGWWLVRIIGSEPPAAD